MAVTARELGEILTPLIQRLESLEAQERLDQRYYQQQGGGHFFISNNEEGYNDHNVVDFWMDVANKKLRHRSEWIVDADNPAQILAGRFNAATFQGYVKANTSLGAKVNVFHIQALGAVADAAPGVPDLSHLARISFWTTDALTLGDTPGMIVFQTTLPGTAQWNVDESSYMFDDANWQIGEHTLFGPGGADVTLFPYSDGNFRPGGGRFNIFGGSSHAEAVLYTQTHALRARDTFGGAKTSMKFMFKDEDGNNADGVKFLIFKTDDYYGGSGQWAAGLGIWCMVGGTLTEYMRFTDSASDRKLRILGKTIATGGGLIIDPIIVQAWGAAYRYLLIEPTTGDIAVSALGPAS